jgi:hypothetical protein
MFAARSNWLKRNREYVERLINEGLQRTLSAHQDSVMTKKILGLLARPNKKLAVDRLEYSLAYQAYSPDKYQNTLSQGME